MKNATFKFEQTDVAGVETVEISADYDREAFISSGLGLRGSALIRVDGRVAIADAVLRQLGALYSSRETIAGVRFGPGGRRHYRYLSEELVDRVLEQHSSLESIRSYKRRPARELERADAIVAFATDLIDLLP